MMVVRYSSNMRFLFEICSGVNFLNLLNIFHYFYIKYLLEINKVFLGTGGNNESGNCVRRIYLSHSKSLYLLQTLHPFYFFYFIVCFVILLFNYIEINLYRTQVLLF
jgi:hypothetical protein